MFFYIVDFGGKAPRRWDLAAEAVVAGIGVGAFGDANMVLRLLLIHGKNTGDLTVQ